MNIGKPNNSQPSVFELAMIASALANRKPIDIERADTLAREAMSVWQACTKQLRPPTLTERSLAAVEAAKAQCPKVAKFPIPIDGFLRLAFGKNKEDIRMKGWRDYLRYAVQRTRAIELGHEVPLPDITDNDVQERLESFKANSISESAYPRLFLDIQEWRARRKSDRNRKNSQKGWQKCKKPT